MDMNMPMGDGGSSFVPLNDTGVDFSNETQAADFLGDILDDSYFQIIGNQYARYFWYGVVALIGTATSFNILSRIILRSRLRACRSNTTNALRPKNWATRTIATMTAITRETSNLQVCFGWRNSWKAFPTSGSIILIVIYFAFILGLEFINNDYPGAQHHTALGVRAGWLAVAQVPLLILLAGKNNLIGLFTGVNYQRLNVYHRWIARGLLLLATLHFGFQSDGWAIYGLMKLEWDTDTCPPTGMGAYALLLWINLSTLAPFRNLSYEFFVIQHLLTFFGFIIAIMLHLPSTALYTRVYIWIPIGLYFLDRLIRTLRYTWNNISPHKATLIALDGTATKIRVPSRRIKKWHSGAYVLISVPTLGMLQSHPATIMSSPSSHEGDLVFLLKAHRGFTRRLVRAAESHLETESEKESQQRQFLTLIDGPYFSSHNDFACYDILTLISAGTGVTFAASALLNLAHRVSSQKIPLREIHFIWVVKKASWLSWIAEETEAAIAQLQQHGIEVKIQLFVTCDDSCLDNVAEVSGCQGCGGGKCCCDAADASKGGSCCKTDADDEIKSVSGASSTNPTSRYSWAVFKTGRPDFYGVLSEITEQAEGESAIGVCGPPTFSAVVRNTVVRISDDRAAHKGSGAQGLYLHVESLHC